MVSRQNQLEAFADDLKRLANVLQTQDKDVASRLKSGAEGLKKPVAKNVNKGPIKDAREQIELIKYLGRRGKGRKPAGWEVLKGWSEKPSGLEYGVFKNNRTGKVVVAFYGNHDNSPQDLLAVAQHAAGIRSSQQTDGAEIVRRAMRQYGEGNVSVTGHSMGGAVAAVAADKYNVNAILFNSQGVGGFSYSPGQQVHHYFVNGEFATAVQDATGLPEAPGKRYQLQPDNFGDPFTGDHTPWGAHHESAVGRALS